MQTFETTLHYRLVRVGDFDPLTKPNMFAEYMLGAFADCAHEESIWLICMNPKHRPISRTQLKSGPMAAAMTLPRELFKVALLAEANAIAVVRGEPGDDVTMTKHDCRIVKRFGETAERLGIEFVDYIIVSSRDNLCKPHFRSWNASGRP